MYELKDKLVVKDAEYGYGCHFNPITNEIRMESDIDNDEFSEIFPHEYGHFVDFNKGKLSLSCQFREAIYEDFSSFDKNTETGRKNFESLLGDLKGSDAFGAIYDRDVSDNLSAFFKNDPEIAAKFDNENVAYFKHENDYWSKSGNREAEIYANCFSIVARNNKSSCEFMEKYFPNTWNEFKNTIRGE